MKISVIGAGFSGLTAAYYLSKKGFKVEVFEANPGPGGLIKTLETSDGLVETAATSILLTPKLDSLLQDINLKPIFANTESKKRFIFKSGSPQRFPLSLKGAIALIKGIFRILFFKKKWIPLKYESLAEWGNKAFSPEVTQFLISPAMQGIYADSADNLSASLVLNKLFFKKKGTKSKGAINFSKGMGEFILTLENYLKSRGVIFHYNSRLDKNNFLQGTYVLATSMKSAHDIFESIPLTQLKSMTSVTCFFEKTSPISGFGVLFPKSEELTAIGVLLNDCMFKNRSSKGHSETWIIDDVFDKNDDEIVELIKEDRLKAFKRSEHPTSYKITSWTDAFPLYDKNLEKVLEKGFNLPSNIHLSGNYLGSLGLSGILEQNYELAQKMSMRYQ